MASLSRKAEESLADSAKSFDEQVQELLVRRKLELETQRGGLSCVSNSTSTGSDKHTMKKLAMKDLQLQLLLGPELVNSQEEELQEAMARQRQALTGDPEVTNEQNLAARNCHDGMPASCVEDASASGIFDCQELTAEVQGGVLTGAEIDGRLQEHSSCIEWTDDIGTELAARLSAGTAEQLSKSIPVLQQLLSATGGSRCDLHNIWKEGGVEASEHSFQAASLSSYSRGQRDYLRERRLARAQEALNFALSMALAELRRRELPGVNFTQQQLAVLLRRPSSP